jgi:glycosyltransferase involved in cell wall biosynthesis
MNVVSVVIPAYNRAETLSRAIDSVLAQTFEDFEIIVVDDGSTDETPAVVESYDDDRIDYRRLDRNRGANIARNRGIKIAEGDLLSFLDSDDELHPEHLERVVERFWESSDHCAGVYTSFESVIDGRLIDVSIASDSEITATDIRKGNIVGTLSCTTFEAEVFEEIGNFDEELPSGQDLDFYIRVLESRSMVGIEDILVTKHQLEDSIGKDIERKREGFKQIREKHGDNLSAEYKSKQYRVEGQLYAIEGELNRARDRFQNALRLHPKSPITYYFYFTSLFGSRVFTAALSVARRIRKAMKRRRHEKHR